MPITLEEIKTEHAKFAELIATYEKQPFKFDEPIVIAFPALKKGEKWAGVIISADGSKREHIILLPGDNDDANWEAQKKWATSIGGELPDRSESALLFATMKSEFKGPAYWTREQSAGYSDSAWCQGFNNGSQIIIPKSNCLRARAVRRLPI